MQTTDKLELPIPPQRYRSKEPPAALRELVAMAGVRFNGDAPWDIHVHHPELYHRVLTQGTLGFGEAYMDGLWDADAPDQLFDRLLRADLDEKMVGWARVRIAGEILRWKLLNLQRSERAFQVGEQHYDAGNDIFEAMLDPTMSYSCAYWAAATDLNQAQHDNLGLICRKLGLKPGERLLEIGCGWGGLAQHAAQHYGVDVVGVTVSKEQQRLARERCAGLPVDIQLMDYRELTGHFDKAVSVGMFEHVGHANLPLYCQRLFDAVRPGGLVMNHGITARHIDGRPVGHGAGEFINRYVFPHGELPHLVNISSCISDAGLEIVDVESLRLHYARTLEFWSERLEERLEQAKRMVPERALRIWRLYLAGCAYGFRHNWINLHQILARKPLADGSHELPWSRADLYS